MLDLGREQSLWLVRSNFIARSICLSIHREAGVSPRNTLFVTLSNTVNCGSGL